MVKQSLFGFRHHTDNRQRGVVFVEATLILPIFFVIVIALIEFSRVGFVIVTNQFVSVETARWALLGRTTGIMNRVQSISDKAVTLSNSFGLPTLNEQILICPAVLPGCGSSTAGVAGQTMIVRVSRSVTLLYLPMTLNVRGAALYVNEPQL